MNEADGQIQLAGFEKPRRAWPDALQIDPQVWSRLPEMLHQLGDKRYLRYIRGLNMEQAVGGGGVENHRAAKRRLQKILGLAENTDKLGRMRRRLHSGGGSNEQRVVEMFPEFRQTHADRGLAESQPLRRLRYAAGPVQLADYRQKLEIEIGHGGPAVNRRSEGCRGHSR